MEYNFNSWEQLKGKKIWERKKQKGI